MRVQTFKEKMQEVYITNNATRSKMNGRVSFKTMDEVSNMLANKLIILKAHPNDPDGYKNVTLLKNLFIINAVYFDVYKNEVVPHYFIEPIFKTLWAVDEQIPKLIPYNKAIVLTHSILSESWFMGSLRHNSNKGLFSHYGAVYDVYKHTAIRQLKNLNLRCSIMTRAEHVLICGIYEEDISTLPNKGYEFHSKHRDVSIVGNQQVLYANFKVYEITARKNRVGDFLYKVKPF